MISRRKEWQPVHSDHLCVGMRARIRHDVVRDGRVVRVESIGSVVARDPIWTVTLDCSDKPIVCTGAIECDVERTVEIEQPWTKRQALEYAARHWDR